MSEVSLLKLTFNGELVAEASLIVHDQAGAWEAFLNVYPQIAHLICGEVFSVMHVACDDELRAKTDHTGFSIDIQTEPRPQLFVPPTNGHLRGL